MSLLTYHFLPVHLEGDPRYEFSNVIGVVGCLRHSPQFGYHLITKFNEEDLPAVASLCDELESYKARIPLEDVDYAYSRLLALSARREGLIHFGALQSIRDVSLDSALLTAWAQLEVSEPAPRVGAR